MATQIMGGTILAPLVANQLVNIFSHGQQTWKNEEIHKFDVWIGGGPHSRGFWLAPLSIAVEYAHHLIRYMDGGDNALDAAVRMAGKELSGPARSVKGFFTGKDWRGQPFGSMSEYLTAMAADGHKPEAQHASASCSNVLRSSLINTERLIFRSLLRGKTTACGPLAGVYETASTKASSDRTARSGRNGPDTSAGGQRH